MYIKLKNDFNIGGIGRREIQIFKLFLKYGVLPVHLEKYNLEKSPGSVVLPGPYLIWLRLIGDGIGGFVVERGVIGVGSVGNVVNGDGVGTGFFDPGIEGHFTVGAGYAGSGA